MTFSIRTLIVFVTYAAMLSALTVRYPPIGIAVGSTLPLACVLASRDKDVVSRSPKQRIFLAALSMVTIYVAAAGPYYMTNAYYVFGRPKTPLMLIICLGDFVYGPVSSLINSGPITGPLDWYIGEWECYGLDYLFGQTLGDFLSTIPDI